MPDGLQTTRFSRRPIHSGGRDCRVGCGMLDAPGLERLAGGAPGVAQRGIDLSVVEQSQTLGGNPVGGVRKGASGHQR